MKRFPKTKALLIAGCWLTFGLSMALFNSGCDPITPGGQGKQSGKTDSTSGSDSSSGNDSGFAVARDASNMTDSELIQVIREIADECNAKAFKNAQTLTPILRYEWQKIESDVSKLYHKRFQDRPAPSGEFLRALVFYSHNKHFEWLVAEALVGADRKHCEFERSMMTFPFYPERLNQEFLQSGSTQPDYRKLGEAIKSVFTAQKLNDASAQSSNRDEESAVTSQWSTLQTIGGVEYQQRTQLTANETSGLTIAPSRYFKSVASRLQFTASICVREKSNGGEGVAFGPIACSLFTTDDQYPPIDTDLNNWGIVDTKKLDSAILPEETFASEPDILFKRKVACSWKQDKIYDEIDTLQKAVVAELK